jgi:uncharacterized protein (TIGR03083 family)
MTVVDLTATRALTHDEAMALQAAELDVTLRLLRELGPADWTTPVPDCPAWDVRTMYLHVLGACEGAGTRELVHQMSAAMRRRRRTGEPLEANLSAVQVADRAELAPDALLARLTAEAPRVVRRRSRMPGALRSGFAMKVDGPVVERWKLGYLIDTIYLRDLWMHRIDACRALGREPELRAEHDGRIVADVVAEWARRHGQPFTLELLGPAGGRYAVGAGGPDLTMDAVELCRTLSGRAPGTGLLATVVPF